MPPLPVPQLYGRFLEIYCCSDRSYAWFASGIRWLLHTYFDLGRLVVDWPGTVIAVNVGGALIPGLMSLYLLARYRLWLPA